MFFSCPRWGAITTRPNYRIVLTIPTPIAVQQVVVRLIFGEDTGEALLFVQAIAAEIGGLPPPGMSPLQLVESINALNWLHCQADVHSLDTSAPATALGLVGARRYLPFALCTYGHLGLKFLGLVPLSGAAWQSDLACVDSLTGGARVLRSDWNGSLYRPGHVLMVDDQSRAVVLAFRGTLALHDALTDLVCHPLPLDGGRAHGGMLEAAQRVLEELRPDLVATLDGHPGYDLVLTGHSLGAGLASLIATLLGPSMALTTGDASVRCFAFAPPAVLSLQLARQVSHVVSVINGSDMVPRFGMSTTRELRETLARVHSEPGLSAEIQRRRKSSQTVEEPSNPEWARKMLGRVESRRPQEEKLFPPGVLLWSGGSPGDNTRGSAAEPTGPSSFAVVDQLEFDSLLLSGSDMFSAHMPQAYARSVLGTCSIGVAAKEKPGLR